MNSRQREENLIVVSSVEEFGLRHNIPTEKVFSLFRKYELTDLLREQYDVLHTLPISEGADFAEAVLKRRGVIL